ncbi:MBL fold metallo-hydrolase [Haloferula chungangensis]|uniref:MBL fold metallo-hydrolase n=1 Tax=Haloferula chungangensis TaxID=1048331 RepID=A0ABW2L1A4_9BACT
MDLYDAPADVVRKSIIGRGLTPEALATMAGLPTRELMGFLNGDFDARLARMLAPLLEIDSAALCHLPDYQPESPDLGRIRQFEAPFEDEEVNIWFIEADGTTLVIDCGFRPKDFEAQIEALGDQAIHVLITHAHRDHIGGLSAASQSMLTSIHSPSGVSNSIAVSAGELLELGPFTVQAVDLSGHHPETLGYLIKGPGVEAFAVGDAVFAGSIGGCPDSSAFALARRTIEAAFSEIAPGMTLLPGHGPATSLGSEIRSNPFLASWLR